MISEVLLSAAIRHERHRFRNEPRTDFIRGMVEGMKICVRLLEEAATRQKAHIPELGPLDDKDAEILLRHVITIHRMLSSGNRTLAFNRAKAVVELYEARKQALAAAGK